MKDFIIKDALGLLSRDCKVCSRKKIMACNSSDDCIKELTHRLYEAQKKIEQLKAQEYIKKCSGEGQIKLSTAILAIENIKGNCGCPPDKDCAVNQNCSLCYEEYLLSMEEE